MRASSPRKKTCKKAWMAGTRLRQGFAGQASPAKTKTAGSFDPAASNFDPPI
jgi:hypothetical protein